MSHTSISFSRVQCCYYLLPAPTPVKTTVLSLKSWVATAQGIEERKRSILALTLIQSPREHPTPTPDHFETNDQELCNEVICASVTLVSTLS